MTLDTAAPAATDPTDAEDLATMRAVQEELIDSFALVDDWQERYQYIIDLGRALPDMPAALRTEERKVKGCQSQVWLHPDLRDGRLHFQGASDAAIVSGLIALLLKLYSGRTPRAILATPPDFIAEIGLAEHLSPSRGNGLHAMIRAIKAYAEAAA